jgi:hypothetical protein
LYHDGVWNVAQLVTCSVNTRVLLMPLWNTWDVFRRLLPEMESEFW